MSMFADPNVPEWPLWWTGSRALSLADIGLIPGMLYVTELDGKRYGVELFAREVAVYLHIDSHLYGLSLVGTMTSPHSDERDLADVMRNLPSYLMRWALL